MAERRHSTRRAGTRRKGPDAPTGGQTFDFHLSAKVSYGELTPADLADARPVILHSSMVTRTELKVRQSEFFLAMLRQNLHNEVAVTYHLEALLAALREVTYAMQKECKGRPGFDAWYAAKQQEMKEHERLKLLHRLRNKAVHETLEPPNVEFVLEHRVHAGDRHAQALVFESFTIDGLKVDAPVALLEEAVGFMRTLVVEAKERLFLQVPADAQKSVSFRARVLREGPNGTWRDGGPPAQMSVETTMIARQERGDLH